MSINNVKPLDRLERLKFIGFDFSEVKQHSSLQNPSRSKGLPGQSELSLEDIYTSTAHN